MKIKVNGKAHRVGTSKKTGNPYDFIQLHYTAPDRGVEGLASLTVNIDSALYPYEKIIVGKEYFIEYGRSGYVVSFDAAI